MATALLVGRVVCEASACSDLARSRVASVETRKRSVTALTQTKGRALRLEAVRPALDYEGVYVVPRMRALLSDPARSEISATLFDAQVASEEAAKLLLGQAKRLIHQSKAAKRAQERLTAAELRAERECWDGSNRREFDRRNGSVAA